VSMSRDYGGSAFLGPFRALKRCVVGRLGYRLLTSESDEKQNCHCPPQTGHPLILLKGGEGPPTSGGTLSGDTYGRSFGCTALSEPSKLFFTSKTTFAADAIINPTNSFVGPFNVSSE